MGETLSRGFPQKLLILKKGPDISSHLAPPRRNHLAVQGKGGYPTALRPVSWGGQRPL